MPKKPHQTEWNLGLLYKSPKDPQIEKDLQTIEKAIFEFAKKWNGKISKTTSLIMLTIALKEYEALDAKIDDPKPLMYLMLYNETDALDEYVQAQINVLQSRLTKAYNNLLFFELNIGKLPKKTLSELKQANNGYYRHQLTLIEKSAKHQLSEPEEKILSLKSLPARSMWVSGVAKAQSKLTITYKGKEVPAEEAAGIMSEKTTGERRKLNSLVNQQLKTLAPFAESELSAVITDKKINDELRDYEKPYSATVDSYQNNITTVENLQSVITSNFGQAKKFYELKRQLLGLDELHYADRATPIGKIKQKFTYTDSVDLLREALADTDQKYLDIFDAYLAESRIDVFPKKGKQGGAFHCPAKSMPMYVFLNYTDTVRDATTLAHEIGHAIHSARSKAEQPPLYFGYSTSAAESASTFFEQIFAERLIQQLTPKEKVIYLHDRIQDSIATVFRQIAFFNYECEIHELVRHEGFLTAERYGALMNKHIRSYMGKNVVFDENDGYFFIKVSHFRNFFYVYSYAYGWLISNALYQNYKTDKSYLNKIDQFLSAGGSDTPDNIFKNIGINTAKPAVFETGLKTITDDIALLKKLAKQEGMLK